MLTKFLHRVSTDSQKTQIQNNPKSCIYFSVFIPHAHSPIITQTYTKMYWENAWGISETFKNGVMPTMNESFVLDGAICWWPKTRSNLSSWSSAASYGHQSTSTLMLILYHQVPTGGQSDHILWERGPSILWQAAPERRGLPLFMI